MNVHDFSSSKTVKRFFIFKHFFLFIFFYISFKNGKVSAEDRRPVYIVARMVNSIKEFDEILARGANSVEADLAFTSNGSIKEVHHGYPCGCYRMCDERENFAKYLNHVRDLVNPNHANYKKTLTLLFLDLNVGSVARSEKYKAGEEIAKYLITHLWSNDLSDPQIHVLLSIPHVSDAEVLRGVRHTFTSSNRATSMKKLGFNVGLNDDLNAIRRMWTKLGVKENRWQGDGMTNCFRGFRDSSRLRHAIRIRDSGIGYVDKVYDWTLDTTSQIRGSLRTGVDAILTNFPEKVMSVLQEQEFRNKYRLATVDDNPFSRVNTSPFKSNIQESSINAYVSTIQEVSVAVMGYLWDSQKHRLQRPAILLTVIRDILSRLVQGLKQYNAVVRHLSRKT